MKAWDFNWVGPSNHMQRPPLHGSGPVLLGIHRHLTFAPIINAPYMSMSFDFFFIWEYIFLSMFRFDLV